MAWATSNRASRLPKDWERRKAAVKRRDHGRCQASKHNPRCDGQGTEVDHIHRGDDHRLENLELLNHYCHQDKTNAENKARRQAWAAMKHRPAEKHPGAI